MQITSYSTPESFFYIKKQVSFVVGSNPVAVTYVMLTFALFLNTSGLIVFTYLNCHFNYFILVFWREKEVWGLIQ